MCDRPNFILFITDQHRADYLGCYGHPVLKTPNIDALAEAGVTYDRFYVASPVCMPNRASLMTCRMPSSHGVRSNGIPLSRCNVTFVEALRDAGYDTALIGKSHLQNFTNELALETVPEARPGYFRSEGALMQAKRSDLDDDFYEMERPAFWEQPTPSVAVPFHGFDHVELVTEHGDAVGGDYVAWLKERVADPDALIGADNQLPHDYICPQAVRTAVPAEHYHTAYIAERASEWLESRKGNDKPFFLMVSWPDPHHPFNPPGKYWDMYSPEDMPEPIGFEAEWQPPLHVLRAEETRASGKAALKGMGTIACSKREAMEARALTCGMISMIDDGVGEVCLALEKVGLEDQTIRIFTSDHGDHLGDHRLLFKGSEQYDAITRVPFIWSDPAGARNIRTSEIGQTIDIGTTILETAKIEAPIGMHGQALDVAGGENREFAFIQYDHQREDAVTKLAARVHTVHDGRWRLSLYHGADYGELYDLENDPGELSNLWSDPAAEAEKNRLIYTLAKIETASVDRVPLPTGRA